MTRRYFVPELPKSGGRVELPTSEAHHATRVMRVQVGDSVTLFDGAGSESAAVISQTGRNECLCEAEPAVAIDREPSRAIHFGIALPKPDRARELIERLTELGVASVTPIVAERTQRPPSDSLLEKLRRGVIEACKQCERNRLLEIRPVATSSDFFATKQTGQRLIAHPSPEAIRLRDIDAANDVIAAIGPEGGWTDDEVTQAIEHNFATINLGPRIYRVETAATAIAAVLVS